MKPLKSQILGFGWASSEPTPLKTLAIENKVRQVEQWELSMNERGLGLHGTIKFGVANAAAEPVRIRRGGMWEQ